MPDVQGYDVMWIALTIVLLIVKDYLSNRRWSKTVSDCRPESTDMKAIRRILTTKGCEAFEMLVRITENMGELVRIGHSQVEVATDIREMTREAKREHGVILNQILDKL